MLFYYTLDSVPSTAVFLVQEETEKVRRFVSFTSVTEYLDNKKDFIHCHEVLMGNFYGHPAFDIDFPIEDRDKYPKWEKDMEKGLEEIFMEIYGIKLDGDNFIWLDSHNPDKMSKHLILTKVTFTMWRDQMKDVCQRLKKYPFHPIVDEGIYRKNSTLRLPLNTKLNKNYPLLFKDTTHTFTDGLVKVYNENTYTIGNLLFPHSDMLVSADDILVDDDVFEHSENEENNVSGMDEIHEPLMKLCRRYSKFEILEIKDNFVSLRRMEPGKCPISHTVHEKENAYFVKNGDKIMFGCYRNCKTRPYGKYKDGRKVIEL